MPATAVTPDLAETATRLRLSVGRLVRRLRRESDADLSPSLLSALITIERHGPITLGSLAETEQVRPPTMTRVAAALCEQGLTQRTPDPLDGRSAWLTVTTAGAALLRRRRRRTDAYLHRRLQALPARDLATLQRAAEILDTITEDES